MRLQLTKVACGFKSCLGQLSVRLVVSASDILSLAFDLAGPPAEDAMQTRSRGHVNLAQPLDRTPRKVPSPAEEACEPTAKEITAAAAARARLAGSAAQGQVRLHAPPPHSFAASNRSSSPSPSCVRIWRCLAGRANHSEAADRPGASQRGRGVRLQRRSAIHVGPSDGSTGVNSCNLTLLSEVLRWHRRHGCPQYKHAHAAGLRDWTELESLDPRHCGPQHAPGAGCASPGYRPAVAVRPLHALLAA